MPTHRNHNQIVCRKNKSLISQSLTNQLFHLRSQQAGVFGFVSLLLFQRTTGTNAQTAHMAMSHHSCQPA
ncbi:hypothetical protein RISK_001557 [Rhodopirellula islandica]|uniref:Uncharacterized protein n=1 Tax=Rhodopirellula islandica TaxID=595434 RepID=A0A0J1BIE9_RHOIS|nr:hypothetical protein RISK_001557 [Rhodopirellula islandica]